MVESYNFSELSNLFSPPFIKLILKNDYREKLFEILETSGFIKNINPEITLQNLYEQAYKSLLKNYRCEYIYKNAIANKILLGRHSINTSTLISELRVNNSKADVVILNGTSCVYEIKTELDSLNRLPSQLNDYRQMFDKIYIVTHEKFLKNLDGIIDDRIGLICLSKDYCLSEKRAAISNKINVDPKCIFNSLRRQEYTNIITRIFGYIPDVPNTEIYNECLKLFLTLDPSIAHDEMVKELKKRNKKNRNKEIINSIPTSIKFLCLDDRLNSSNITKLNQILNVPALY